MNKNNNVVVVGSCMIDFVAYCERLPRVGETIHGTKFVTTFGGKGANQCVAAAKLGANTTLIARVGDDLWGEKYIKNLKEENVQADNVKITHGYTTGIAQITVSDLGQNQIVIVAGANTQLTKTDVELAQNIISTASVVVCQLETSPEVALKTLEISQGITILNGAPAVANYDVKLLTLPTIFCVNETEAAVFTGLEITSAREAENAVKALLERGCQSVILTLGSQGALYGKKGDLKVIKINSPQVDCVDSTGAGDAFIGALAYLLAKPEKMLIIKAIEQACFVAADSVTKPGTQISFPGPEILLKLKF